MLGWTSQRELEALKTSTRMEPSACMVTKTGDSQESIQRLADGGTVNGGFHVLAVVVCTKSFIGASGCHDDTIGIGS